MVNPGHMNQIHIWWHKTLFHLKLGQYEVVGHEWVRDAAIPLVLGGDIWHARGYPQTRRQGEGRL